MQTSDGEFFVPASKTNGAFDGDLVQVSRISSTGAKPARTADGKVRPSARVVRVLVRAHDAVVGRYEVAEPFGVVIPEDPRIQHDIFTLRRDAPQVRDGDVVRVRVTSFPTRNQPAQGVVEEVLGHVGDANLDVELVVARHKLETRFSDAALQLAQSATVGEREALDVEGYRDLRDRIVFTIDPADARDYDDALSFDQVGSLYRVGVHIADVSRYVPWATPLDLEARRRSTSVYLVDRVVPMLPEALSNDVCSLVPGQPRRTMTVDLFYTQKLGFHHAEFYPSVIRSDARLTYDDVQACLDAQAKGDDSAARAAVAMASGEAAQDVASRIEGLHRVAQALHAERKARGGMDFENPEAKVELDENGRPVAVHVRVTTDATSLVEECMLAANEAVAQKLLAAHAPSVFRVHEAPDALDLADVVPVLDELGYGRRVSLEAFASGMPEAVQAVTDLAHGRPEEPLVSMLVIRCMKRAHYAAECMPHYGLGSAAYVHFTSPIRRYPDLMVHRALKAVLLGRDGTTSAQEDALGFIADHASKQERTAEAAARESQEMKLYELLDEHVGECFDGLVSGVSAAGFYVRLDNTAEGFVSLRMSREYFELDPVRRTLVGTDTGTVYRLGDKVRIRVSAVRPYERKADFALVQRIGNARIVAKRQP